MRLAAFTTVAFALLTAAPAHAATLHVATDAAQANRITISGTAAAVTVTDGSTTLIDGAPASDLVIDLGDGDDTLTVATSVPVTVIDGPGDDGNGGADRLEGRGGNDRLYGGAGNDTITGGRGADELNGSSGRDRLNARDSRREAVRCGSGRDRVTSDSIDMRFRCEWRGRR